MIAAINSVLDYIDDLLMQTGPLPIRREGTDPRHLIADPPMTRAQAIEWLWEGRMNPPVERFRPDPMEGAPENPQRRFHFDVTPEEFAQIREEFRKRYLAGGPGITLVAQLNAIPWLPEAIYRQIIDMEARGDFQRKYWPRVVIFPGEAPWGDIVLWAGQWDFANFYTIEVYQYLPSELEYYQELTGSDQRGRLLHHGYTSWNEDMRYFVETKKMRPSLARDELLRIYTDIFKTMMQTISDIFTAAAGQVQAKSMLNASSASVSESVLASYRAKRRAFGLAARRKLPAIVIWRGTTARLKEGRSPYKHDLGIGTYFTTSSENAVIYANMRGTVDDPAIILTREITSDELGRVLDLVNGPHAKRWNEVVEMVGETGLVNERYNDTYLEFLEEIGQCEEDFDTIIGRDYIRPGIQINVRNNDLADSILLKADEIWRTQ